MEKVFHRAEQNLRALELLSSVLNECPCLISPQELRSFTGSTGLSEEEAMPLLVAARCGLREEEADDREIERLYFRRSIRRLDPADCRNDPYYRNIHLPEVSRGGWEMGWKTIRSCELFTADDPLLLPEGIEIPRVGWFSEDFFAPVVRQDGREWMTVTPSERATMLRDIDAAHGDVVAFGLGLGYYAYMAARKENVSRVTVVEKDPAVLALFEEYLLPQMECREKIVLKEADAFAYAAEMPRHDCAYVDIWHDVLDGTPLYLKMKRLEKYSPGTEFRYWIEPSMLSFLRSLFLWQIREEGTTPVPLAGQPCDGEELMRMLSDRALRSLAPEIPPETVMP